MQLWNVALYFWLQKALERRRYAQFCYWLTKEGKAFVGMGPHPHFGKLICQTGAVNVTINLLVLEGLYYLIAGRMIVPQGLYVVDQISKHDVSFILL
jgi:hypothetical protein